MSTILLSINMIYTTPRPFSFEILRECPPWGKPLLIVWQRWYSTLWKIIYHLFRWLDIYLSNHLSIKESLTYDTVVNYVYCSILDLWPYNHLSIHLFLTKFCPSNKNCQKIILNVNRSIQIELSFLTYCHIISVFYFYLFPWVVVAYLECRFTNDFFLTWRLYWSWHL